MTSTGPPSDVGPPRSFQSDGARWAARLVPVFQASRGSELSVLISLASYCQPRHHTWSTDPHGPIAIGLSRLRTGLDGSGGLAITDAAFTQAQRILLLLGILTPGQMGFVLHGPARYRNFGHAPRVLELNSLRVDPTDPQTIIRLQRALKPVTRATSKYAGKVRNAGGMGPAERAAAVKAIAQRRADEVEAAKAAVRALPASWYGGDPRREALLCWAFDAAGDAQVTESRPTWPAADCTYTHIRSRDVQQHLVAALKGHADFPQGWDPLPHLILEESPAPAPTGSIPPGQPLLALVAAAASTSKTEEREDPAVSDDVDSWDVQEELPTPGRTRPQPRPQAPQPDPRTNLSTEQRALVAKITQWRADPDSQFQTTVKQWPRWRRMVNEFVEERTGEPLAGTEHALRRALLAADATWDPHPSTRALQTLARLGSSSSRQQPISEAAGDRSMPTTANGDDARLAAARARLSEVEAETELSQLRDRLLRQAEGDQR